MTHHDERSEVPLIVRLTEERDLWKKRHDELLQKYLAATAPPDDEDLSMNEGY